MSPRILLIHAYLPSVAPIVAAFKSGWPEAEIVNLLDDTLYADVGADGVLPPGMVDRVRSLLHHGVLSGADSIVFTGSTFGPAVDAARDGIAVPVLKADEAMCEKAVAAGGRILVVCTARRALPVIRANLDAAARAQGVSPAIAELCVEGAKDAITAGDLDRHDRLIAAAVENGGEYDTVMLGQISMVPALALLPPAIQARVLTSPDASVAHMRALLQRAPD